MNKNISYMISSLVLLMLSVFMWITSSDLVSSVLFGFGSAVGIALLILDEKKFVDIYTQQGVTGRVIITRSFIFILSLVPLGLFVTTSSGSSLGKGLIMALLFEVWLEMAQTRTDLSAFNTRFLSQLRRPLGQQSIQALLILIGFFWLYLLVATVIV